MSKKWTPEERKAAGERLRQARIDKAKLAQESADSADQGLKDFPTPRPQEVSNQERADLQRQIDELKSLVQGGQLSNVAATQRGLIGTLEKYAVDPAQYPNPCQRLSQEPRLARFAFPINYELTWEVSTTSYDTIDGIRTREPRFTLELNVIVRDEDTQEPTNGRYTLRRAIFHEDPQAALVVARENGLEVDESNQKAFLDEMRYIRMRNWLLEAFYPPRTDQKKQRKREMSIGNKIVEYFEVGSSNSETMPFDQLKTKL